MRGTIYDKKIDLGDHLIISIDICIKNSIGHGKRPSLVISSTCSYHLRNQGLVNI